MSIKDLFGDIPLEGAERVDDSEAPKEETTAPKETETPSQEGVETQPEDTEAKAEETEDENTPDESQIPFHKNPRWIAREEKYKSEIEQLRSEYDQKLQQFEQKLTSTSQTEEIPQWFVDQFGDDQNLYKVYKEENERQKREIAEIAKREVLEQIKNEKSSQETQEKQMLEWVDGEISRLGETLGKDLSADGANADERNEILQIALESSPTDEKGNIDLAKAYGIYQDRKRIKELENKIIVNEKKQVAANSMDSGSKQVTEKQTFSSDDFKGGLARLLINK